MRGVIVPKLEVTVRTHRAARSFRKFSLVAVFVFAALLLAAPGQAAVSCAYDSGLARVTVTMGAALDSATVSRAGNTIQVVGTGGLTGPCGAATVRNTNAVYVSAPGAGQHTVVIALVGGPFAPGKTRESSGVSEIEFHLDLGGSTDEVTIDGGSQGENIRLGSSGVNLNGDRDADLLPSGVEEWRVVGSGGSDIISAAGGRGTGGNYGRAVSFSGDQGNDVLTGGPGADGLAGGPGNDRITGGAGPDSLYGDPGSDRLDGGDGVDALTAGTGKDLVLGGPGVDLFYSEAGMDGADDLRGGPGRDYAYYYARAGNQRLSLDNRANDGLTGEKDNIRSDIESIYSGSGDDRLIGNAAANVFEGGAGNDIIEGGAGDDNLTGGFGATSGNDTMKGGGGDDSLNGGDGADNLDGGPGEDSIYGEAGNDTVAGGSGDDWVYEGATANGADALSGGAGVDTVFYGNRVSGVGVRLDAAANDGEVGELDNVAGDFEVAYGGSNNDVFLGNAFDNHFYAGAGADTAAGGAGEDTFFGGAGTDNLTGDDGTDHLFGQEDADTLNAIDGGYDQIFGGTGVDVCNGDAVDSKFECP